MNVSSGPGSVAEPLNVRSAPSLAVDGPVGPTTVGLPLVTRTLAVPVLDRPPSSVTVTVIA